MKRTEVPIALEKPEDDALFVEIVQWDGDAPRVRWRVQR